MPIEIADPVSSAAILSTSGQRKQTDRVQRSESAGFPRSMVALLRCVADGAEIRLSGEFAADRCGIYDGLLECTQCQRQYPVEAGIVRMLEEDRSGETDHEIALKDQEYEAMAEVFEPPPTGWRSRYMDAIEIPPHLSMLKLLPGLRMVELGCGDGRLTLLCAQMGVDVLAVDFSLWALRRVRGNLVSGTAPTTYRLRTPFRQGNLSGYVGLVQADASRLRLAPRSFQRALSATPLDSRDERMGMYAAISEALTDDGRYLAGVEHDDLQRRMLGLAQVRRYFSGGILIEHLDRTTMAREMAPYFGRQKMRLIRPRLPLCTALPPRLRLWTARLAARTPVVQHFGEILLNCAENPRRQPQDGQRRTGIPLLKSLFRAIKRRRGQQPTWSSGDGLV